MRAVIKVAPDTLQNSYTWRFFCESKYFNPNTNKTEAKYPFDKDKYPQYPDGKIYKTVRVLDGLVSPFLLPIEPI